MRQFETGATRDSEGDKIDFEGFLSPTVLEAFGRYMTKHRKQADGKLRDSDNWQKGIPKPVYMKSLWRHFHQLWKLHRGLDVVDEKGNVVTLEDAVCACMFNLMGYLFECQRPAAQSGPKIEPTAPKDSTRYFTLVSADASRLEHVWVFEPGKTARFDLDRATGKVLNRYSRNFWSLADMLNPSAWSDVCPTERPGNWAISGTLLNTLMAIPYLECCGCLGTKHGAVCAEAPGN